MKLLRKTQQLRKRLTALTLAMMMPFTLINPLPANAAGTDLTPVAEWSFDETSGTTFTDDAGKYNGNLTGAASWEAGVHDNALKLNKAYADLGTPQLTDEWTTTFWINKGANTYDTALLFGGHDNGAIVKLEQWKNTEKIGITTSGGDYTFNYIIPEGEWVHIALTGNDSETVLYVNGEKTGTIGKGMDCPVKYLGTDLKHKDRNPVYEGNMVGSVDDLKLFDRVLTDEEILLLSGNFEAIGKEELKAVIDEAKALSKEDYTERTWSVFEAALADAEAVYADETASELDVNRVYNALTEAKEGLVEALEENHFNVASFNIAANKHPNIPEISDIMEDLNITVAGVQEVDMNTGRNNYDMMQRFLDQGYFSYSHFRKAMDFAGGQYGNGILAQSELTNLGGELLPWKGGMEQRAYTRAEVEIEGKTVAVYSTHLNYESLEVRTLQIEKLIEVLDNDPTEYKILTGDFNTNNSQEEFAPFTENYDIANGKDGNWINTIIDGSAGSGEIQCIDNIITTRNIQVNNVDALNTGCSDHYLLYAECEFAEESEERERVNFALNKPVTASHNDGNGPEKAVDGDLGTRWGTDPYGSNQWLRVDLGETKTFDEFLVASEAANGQKMRKFKIEGSADDSNYELIYDSEDKEAGFGFENTIKLEQPASCRYVKITVEKLISGAYPSVSLREFQVIGEEEDYITDVKNALKKLSVPSKVYREFDVPVKDAKTGVVYTWEAMNDAVAVDAKGHVTLNVSESRQDSGLRVTASKNGYSQEMEFTFTVFKNELKDYQIYPVPQHMTYAEDENAVLALADKVTVSIPKNTDVNTKNYIQKVFAEHQLEVTFINTTAKAPADFYFGVVGDGSAADNYFAEKEYDKTVSTDVGEGYVLAVDSKAGTVAVLGHDSFGLFNGVSTLAQMLDSSRSQLKDVLIEDSPNTLFRGIIEGFYGQYSHKERLDLIEFIGPLKMNTYIYGAKNDPYHNGQWREPYPEKELNQIGELVQRGKESNVELVWSAHVGGHIDMGNEADYKALTDKFDQLYSIGVRQFALFYDDAWTDPTHLVEFINRLNREYINTKPGVKDLIFCPEQYCKTRVSGNYLDTISNFDKDVQIMWTGDSVISEVSPSMMEWIEARIKRPAYIWWNYPVNDLGLGNQMLVGETAGLSTEMESINGLVSNPMLQAQASKFSLFSIADYGWNIKAFDSYKSWDAAVDYIIDEKEYADAFKLFSANNNQSVAELKEMSVESAELAKVFDEFRAAYYAGEDVTALADQLIAEFKQIEDACALLRTYHNTDLVNQITPWLNQLVPVVKSGQKVVENLKNIASKDLADEEVFKAAAEQYKEEQKTLKNIGGKWSGRKEIIPFLQEMQASIHQTLLAQLGEKTIRMMTNYRDGAYLKSKMPELADGNDDTAFQLDEKETDGKWFGVDLGSVQTVDSFEIVIGANDADTNTAPAYKVQVSNDSINWTDVDTVKENNHITNAEEATARFIRYYAEEGCGKNVQVREFFVNNADKTVLTNVEQKDSLFVTETLSSIAVGAKEDVTVKPNEFIGIQFENAKKMPVIENGTALTLEYSVDNVNWTEYTEGEVIAKYVRIKNQTEEAVVVNAADDLFTIRLTDAVVPTDMAVEEIGLATWSGNKDQIIDGNRSSYHWTKEQKVGNGYVIDMKNPVKLYDVTVVMGDGDFMERGVVEVSTDKNTWEEVGVISGAKVTTVYPNKEARYIRVKMTKDSGTWLKLAEVEINKLAKGTDAPVVSDAAAKAVVDGDVTTAFTCPNEAGSFEFYNYQAPQADELNIYKNAGAVKAEAFVDGAWVVLEGTGNEVVTYALDAYETVSKFRISWEAGSNAVIYEMGVAEKAYEPEDVEHCVITVEGGTIAETGLAEGIFAYNDKVTVKADDTDRFAGWEVNGKLVSTDVEYTFYVSGDMTVTAVYETKEMTAEAMLTNVITTKRADGKYDVKFVAQLVVPEGYKLNAAGLVWSSKNDAVLELNGDGTKTTYISRISNTDQFSVTIKGMPAGKSLRGRIFATLEKDAAVDTVYSVEEKVVTRAEAK